MSDQIAVANPRFAKRAVALAACFALLGAPAAPLASRAPSKPMLAPDDPVRCNTGVSSDQGRKLGRPRLFSPPPTVNIAPILSPSMALPAPSTTPSVAPFPAPPPSLSQFSNAGFPEAERYRGEPVAAIKSTAQDPVSTFSVDVDTGSYANVRRILSDGQMPPVAAVRTEEMLNYFRYDYPKPTDRSRPFSVTTDVSMTPWNENTHLLRIGIRGFDLPRDERPPSNLVFLVDVSGSMSSPDKLPLVKSSLNLLAGRLSPRDKVSIVVYAGAAGIVLNPTNDPRFIKRALDCLEAGGSTAGGQGMELAYATARAHFIKGGVNRVIMATDGDFNVGISSNDGIEAIVKKNCDDGITLTTLGFGQGNYNEAMMERVADIGNGNYAYIDSALEAQKVLDEEMESTLFTIAKDVKIQLEFNPIVVREYRLVGYENRILAEEDFDNDKVDAGDIGAGHQVTALYEIVTAGRKGWLPERRYEGNKSTGASFLAAPRELAHLKLRYKLPDGEKSMLIEKPVEYGLLQTAAAPRGDMAFAVAVAGFGQKLRDDKYLGNFSYADVRRVAGPQSGYLRAEFIKLATLADRQ